MTTAKMDARAVVSRFGAALDAVDGLRRAWVVEDPEVAAAWAAYERACMTEEGVDAAARPLRAAEAAAYARFPAWLRAELGPDSELALAALEALDTLT